MTTTKQLLEKLFEQAARLSPDDPRHQQIADSLSHYGRRRFGPRFGDGQYKPKIVRGHQEG